ncbi:hypothetical protein AAG906_029295 [Vitis piasezkii]
MEEAKTMKTPMSSSIKLDKDEKGKSIDSTMYKSMIGSLLYLTASRPDIMYSVCLCARFQSCPKESHLRTMDIGLWYPKGDNFELIGFSDADFDHEKRKCTKIKALTIDQAGCAVLVAHKRFLTTLQHFEGFRFDFWDLGLRFGTTSPSARVIAGFSSVPARLGETTTSKAQDKCPTEPSQYDTGLFSSVEDYQRYKQKSINFSQLQYFGFEGLFGRMGWLPIVMISELIFPTLVHEFYSRVTYGLGGLIISTVRGVEIQLDPESIFRIFDIPPVGLRVYESKAWPIVSGFEPKEGQGQVHPGVDEKAEIHEMEGVQVEATFSEPMMFELTYTVGPSSQPSFTDMDQQQATFEHLQQRIERIESHQESQHKEMMAYLHSMFPPPPPQP